MSPERSNPPSFSAGRKWAVALNVLVAIAALLLLVTMVNYLAARHFKRFHWTAATVQPLSPMTVRVLESLTNQVKVVVLFNSQEPLYGSVAALLKEYAFVSPWLNVQYVDYLGDPAGAQLVKVQNKLAQGSDRDLVIFESGGKVKIVNQSELSEYDYSELLAQKSREIKRVAFKGELLFTSAILSVTDPKQPKACYLQGHGEHNPANATEQFDYAKFIGVLREKNIVVEVLSLAGANDIPADCQVLIIAGPKNVVLPEELEKIEKYLNQGGRLFLLINALVQNTGLERTLTRWGVEIGNDIVKDPLNSSLGGQDVVAARFGNHPIVRPLLDSRLHLILPRTVGKRQAGAQTADAAKVEELVFSSEASVAVTDIRNGVLYENPARDRRGPLSLMVAVEKGGIQGVSAERGATRMVVAGESMFLGNQMIEVAANRDFAGLAVNWLLDRSKLLGGIGPRPVQEFKLNLTREQMRELRWILLAALPAGVLLLGGAVWFRRRH